jgi:hypothetical protein
VQKTWRERLLSWKPWVKYKWVSNPTCPEDGTLMRAGDCYYGSAATISMIQMSARVENARPGTAARTPGWLQ